MFYIVRGWIDGAQYEQEFDDLQSAQSFLYQVEGRAELYVWLGGREYFMESKEG